MKQLTITELRKALQDAEKQGFGDRLIVTADDEEGNGFHGIYFAVTPGEELAGSDIYDSETTDVTKLVCIG